MEEMNAIDLNEVTGGCDSCELNPPSTQDLYNGSTMGIDTVDLFGRETLFAHMF